MPAIPLIQRHAESTQQPHRLRHQSFATGLVDGRALRVIESYADPALP